MLTAYDGFPEIEKEPGKHTVTTKSITEMILRAPISVGHCGK